MTRRSRLLIAVAALLLTGMYVLPLWSITLVAPQYPEGLGMLVRLSSLTGVRPTDLANINGLNHYIGMRPIDAKAIPELRWMPLIVGVIIALGLVAALIGRRRLVVAWIVSLVAFGVLGIADFWRWSYDYGHHLDAEHAIIKVPGMSYQPPLIGTKHLLNFTATSWPGTGVWLAVAALVLGVVALRISGRRTPSTQRQTRKPEPERIATVVGVGG